jgi:hypothetical protein
MRLVICRHVSAVPPRACTIVRAEADAAFALGSILLEVWHAAGDHRAAVLQQTVHSLDAMLFMLVCGLAACK